MSQRTRDILVTLAVAFFAWSVYGMLMRVHSWLVLAAILFTGVNLAVTWLLRFDPQRLVSVYDIRFPRFYVDWVCRWTGHQPPIAASSSTLEMRLWTDREFAAAAERAKQVVLGHDQVLDQIFSRVRESLRRRERRRDHEPRPPLASILLAGHEGIGKRYLARTVGKLFLRSNSVLVFECDQETPVSLFGTKDVPGTMLESVRRQPFQMIILERIDAASPDLVRALKPIVTRGACRSPQSRREISFENTLFVMTTTKGVRELGYLATSRPGEREWHEKAIEIVTAETGLERSFVNGITDVLPCRDPSDEVKFKVTALLMEQECRLHGVTLVQADPLVFVSEVLRIKEDLGFATLRGNVERLLSKPLLAAMEEGHQRMSLHVRERRVSLNIGVKDEYESFS